MTKKRMPSHHGVGSAKGVDIHPDPTVKLLYERASCRNFRRTRVSKETVDLIIGAGCHAPTGGNLQPYSVIVIRKEKIRQRLAKMCSQSFMAKAPLHLLFCIDFHRLERWARLEAAPFTARSSFRHFWISFQDTTICAQNICTAADALGLGSVYIGTVMEFFPRLQKMFKLPRGVLPVVLLCVGYPKYKIIPRRKLGVAAIAHNDHYRELPDQKIIGYYNDKYPDVKVEATDKRLRRFQEVCQRIRGKRYAQQCLERIRETGYINHAQRVFGLHYCADHMPDGNEVFLKTIEELGFSWFRKCSAHREADDGKS